MSPWFVTQANDIGYNSGYAIGYTISYGIGYAIVNAINLEIDYCYYISYSTIFGYDISHCLQLLKWLCH